MGDVCVQHIVQERCGAGVGGVQTDQKEVKEVLRVGEVRGMALYLGGTPREAERHVLHLRGHGLAPQMRLVEQNRRRPAQAIADSTEAGLAAQVRLG